MSTPVRSITLGGNVTELTIITPITPGKEGILRKVLEGISLSGQNPVSEIGTIHFARWVMFDKDARLLFTSNFDGSLEKYIGDFSKKIPGGLDAIWGNCDDYPGSQPIATFLDYVRRFQIPTTLYYAAYPSATVQDVLQALRWKNLTNSYLQNLADPTKGSS